MRPDSITDFILDCDGVLLESVGIKTDIVVDLLQSYEGDEEDIRDYHARHPGMHRSRLFRNLIQRISGESPSPDTVDQLCSQFARACKEKIARVELVPGTRSFLRQAREQSARLHVVSGTPQEELEYILSKQNLAELLDTISGSPPNKQKRARSIFEKYEDENTRFIVIGDAREDLAMAEAIDCPMIYRRSTGEHMIDEDRIQASLKNLEELRDVLQQDHS